MSETTGDEPITAEALEREGFVAAEDMWQRGCVEVSQHYGFNGMGRSKADRIYRFEVAIRQNNNTDPNDMYSDPESVVAIPNCTTMADLRQLVRLMRNP